jgi:hypothetical protein
VTDPAKYERLTQSLEPLNAPYETIPIDEPVTGLAHAYQIGTDRAKGRFIVYCHQSLEIADPNFPTKIRNTFNHHGRIGFLGLIGSVTNLQKKTWRDEPALCVRGRVPGNPALQNYPLYNGFARLVDGLLLITEHRFPFPDWLPGSYGLDTYMCMLAERQGFRNWITGLPVTQSEPQNAPTAEAQTNLALIQTHLTQELTSTNTQLKAEGLDDCSGHDLAVVIPVVNNYHYTKNCLASLFQDVPDAEVIVIDNASTDETPTQLPREFPRVKYIRNPQNIGVAASWNFGLKMSKRDVLCVLNNDTLVGQGGMRVLLRETRKQGAASIGGARLNANFGFNGPISDVDQAHYLDGSVLLFTRKIWDQVGPFDERFFPAYSEDADYGLRLHLAGIDWAIVPNSVMHFGSQTAPKMMDVGTVSGSQMEKLRNKWAGDPRVKEFLNR